MTPLLPDHCLDIAAEAEIDLEDVDSCLPEDDALTSETGHQVLRDNAHANVRLRAEVWQNVLKQDSVRYSWPGTENGAISRYWTLDRYLFKTITPCFPHTCQIVNSKQRSSHLLVKELEQTMTEHLDFITSPKVKSCNR